jgi:Tfp pilus assembly protein FimT
MLVTFFVLAVLAGILLQALAVVQRQVERTLVEADVMSLRTELQLAVASAINRGNEGQLSEWVAGNPLELVGRQEILPKPEGGAPLQLQNEWRWDRQKKVLIYEFSDSERFQLRVARANALERAGWSLGGGLILIRE